MHGDLWLEHMEFKQLVNELVNDLNANSVSLTNKRDCGLGHSVVVNRYALLHLKETFRHRVVWLLFDSLI